MLIMNEVFIMAMYRPASEILAALPPLADAPSSHLSLGSNSTTSKLILVHNDICTYAQPQFLSTSRAPLTAHQAITSLSLCHPLST